MDVFLTTWWTGTGSIDPLGMAFDIGLGMLQGSIGTRATNTVLKKIVLTQCGMPKKIVETLVGTSVDTGMDALMSALFGRDFDFWDSLKRNAFTNTFAAFISDPVDAVTGTYTINTTDFILASLPDALKIERTYNSTSREESCPADHAKGRGDCLYLRPCRAQNVYRKCLRHGGTCLHNSRNFVTSRTDGEGYTSHTIYDRMGNMKAYYSLIQWETQGKGYKHKYDYLERVIDTITPLRSHERVFRNFDGEITRDIHPVSYAEQGENGDGTRTSMISRLFTYYFWK